jgi:hypothetical protein
MSYEYVATIDESAGFSLPSILRSDALARYVEVLSAAEGEARFRLRLTPIRTERPEDLTVYRTPHELHVAFHSATAAQRESFLALLKHEITQASGCPISFDEA